MFKNVSPETKLRVIKKIAVPALLWSAAASYSAVHWMTKYQKEHADNKVNSKMLTRFTELAEPYLIEQIKKEFEFDVITRHLDI